ncbi:MULTISPECIES: hypothetical protein [Pyrobaculum]|uniref:PaREP2b n=2 Tax=Pyrobaculum arsenaticum TaxID=121277 RepID=A4WM60_PYRAR|nr:hypothetical protein [Pyrobaculum arsenaticum]ABP51477.1 conserved hypothetical protein [Pyrobaculum arsenaticum DSM 13514]MCY0890954.1 hypothetical protein [Pyrobaculum arsenaticum]NYR16554.1 hypothetical protein [Pyrobaculum arsenaticum]
MSLYVLEDKGLYIECDMEYGPEKDISCTVKGVTQQCVEEAVRKTGYSAYMKIEGNRLLLSTSVFKAGKTPGELIKEIFFYLRLC